MQVLKSDGASTHTRHPSHPSIYWEGVGDGIAALHDVELEYFLLRKCTRPGWSVYRRILRRR